MERIVIQKILEAGVRAPSGENCQPWRFTFEGETLFVYNVPDRDISLYNFNQLGSYVAHGALIENIGIAASSFGYAISVDLFPLESDINCVARITFVKDDTISADPLNDYIDKRFSNRTPYHADALSEAERETIRNAGKVLDLGGRVILVEDTRQKRELGHALSYADRILFENEKLHDFLFEHIHWTMKDAETHKAGFYVKELGLTPPQEAVFKLLRKKSWLRFFNRIGFPKMAAQGNISLYSNVSALGAIAMQKSDKKDFVNGGRIMERVWLTATQLGYDIQPITAILFFAHRISANAAQDFSTGQIERIKKSYVAIQNKFGLLDDTAVMLFRIGKGNPVAHRAFRNAPEITYR